MAPMARQLTATSTSATAVIITDAMSGQRARICFSSSIPSMRGMRRSLITSITGCFSSNSIASSPLAAS